MSTRRIFLMQSLTAGAGLAVLADASLANAATPKAATAKAPAAAPAPAPSPAVGAPSVAPANMLSESDAAASAMGYVSDATRANRAKFPKYAPKQACANCALYQGAKDSKNGPCPLFAGKAVAATGWCSAYAAVVASPVPVSAPAKGATSSAASATPAPAAPAAAVSKKH